MSQANLLSLVGGTPLVEVKRLNPYPGVTILAKIECRNPGGSIKDRVAIAMIRRAEESGELIPGKTVIEATSGNTGVGLAMVCAIKGYPCTLLMPETASEERKRIMRAYGAEIRLTPGRMGTDGAIEEAYRLAREEPDRYVLMDQFNNPASTEAHYLGTGLEIWEQTGGKVSHVVIALGTSGTAMGVKQRMAEMNPECRVVAVEPYAGHKIQGLKNMHESYPPGIFNRKALDQIVHVEDEEAFELCRRLAREEGIFAGMSSGAALGGALKIAATLESGLIVVIFPDSGERYLSTPLFAPRAERGVRLDDLASRSPRTLTPGPGGVGLYTTGPTLDAPDDPDAWRRVLLLDVLARHLAAKGQKARVVAGLADYDDRTMEAAREAGHKREDFAIEAAADIARRGALLGLSPSVEFPRAQEATETALDLCRRLLSKGLAYEKLRSVYFDTDRDKEYGALAGGDVSELSAGWTVDLEAYAKDNPRDFTLLKRAALKDLKQGEILATEWGNVRPSWLLQHAALALESLPGRGERPGLTAVLGSEAHRFPHLENLRAVWASSGTRPLCFAAVQPVTRDEDVPGDLQGLLGLAGGPQGLRLWFLSASPHKSLTLSARNLAMWAANQRKVQDLAAVLSLAAGKDGKVGREVEQACFDLRTALEAALEEGLSLHRFWPALFKFVKQANARLGAGAMTPAEASACLERLNGVDQALNILDHARLPLPETALPEAARAVLTARDEARKARDFARADVLRQELAGLGFRVEDAPGGMRLFRA
jgi:cysteinyl-tRNA synthetase